MNIALIRNHVLLLMFKVDVAYRWVKFTYISHFDYFPSLLFYCSACRQKWLQTTVSNLLPTWRIPCSPTVKWNWRFGWSTAMAMWSNPVHSLQRKSSFWFYGTISLGMLVTGLRSSWTKRKWRPEMDIFLYWKELLLAGLSRELAPSLESSLGKGAWEEPSPLQQELIGTRPLEAIGFKKHSWVLSLCKQTETSVSFLRNFTIIEKVSLGKNCVASWFN